MDEGKYTNCHIDDSSIKHHYANGHGDDGDSMGVIKTEDSHTYVLPPFLH